MKRLVTGLIAGACWLALLLTGPFALFWAVVALIGGLGLREYAAMALPPGMPLLRTGMVAAGLLPVLAACGGRFELVAAALIPALVLASLLVVVSFHRLDDGFLVLARMLAGTLWIGLGTALLILLLAETGGRSWLLFLTALTVGSDTGAYYVGRLCGRHKLCPAVSPGKTVEGFAGGLTVGAAAALTVGLLLPTGTGPALLAPVAFALAAIGVLGDLTESVVKRSVGVKDSGTLLPGHGGVLDRADSLLLTAPVLYVMVHFGVLPGL